MVKDKNVVLVVDSVVGIGRLRELFWHDLLRDNMLVEGAKFGEISQVSIVLKYKEDEPIHSVVSRSVAAIRKYDELVRKIEE